MLMQERPQRPTISVIIPARNEGGNLPFVLPHLPSIVSEVILVDGHSIDDTIVVARQLLPSIRIVKQVGKGKGDAIRAGIAASTGDIIVMLDADGSADPYEMPNFVAALMAGNDFAKGSRFAKGGGSHDLTLIRSMGNYGLTDGSPGSSRGGSERSFHASSLPRRRRKTGSCVGSLRL